LLDLCLVFPPEGCDHARGHKLPFLASELFGYELNAITSTFFEENDEVSPVVLYEKVEDNSNDDPQEKKMSFKSNRDDVLEMRLEDDDDEESPQMREAPWASSSEDDDDLDFPVMHNRESSSKSTA